MRRNGPNTLADFSNSMVAGAGYTSVCGSDIWYMAQILDIENSFLLFCELPENVFVLNINFGLHYSESLAGNVKCHLMNSTTQADEGLQL